MKMMIILFITIISIFGFTEADKPNINPAIESQFSTSILMMDVKSYEYIVNPRRIKMVDQPKIELGILIQKVSNGLMIIDILMGSPYAKAGFEKGDILTKFNNNILVEPADLQESFRNAPNGSKNKLSYFTKGQLFESEMIVIVQKLKNAAITLKIISNKTSKAANIASLKESEIQAYLSVLPKSDKGFLGKGYDSIGTITNIDNAGNTTISSFSGGADGKKLKEIQKVNQKEVDEYLKNMKISNATVEKYFADGKIPANIQVNLTNATTVKDALNQMAIAGIKVDDAKVKKYLVQNGIKDDFGNIQLNQVLPAEVLALYGKNGPVNKRARVSRLSKLNDPNSAAIIKQLESLNNAVDGEKKGTKKTDGVADFSYTKSTGIGSNNDSSASKDFVPAYIVKQKNQLIDANGDGKPVFIPSVKPAEKKAGDHFSTKDFIPADLNGKNSNKNNGNNLNEVLPITPKDASKWKEKNGDQPVFIPSAKKNDNQSSEIESLISQMRRVADANLKLKQSNSTKVGNIETITALDQNTVNQKKNLQGKPTTKSATKTNTDTSVEKPKKINTVDSLKKIVSVKSDDSSHYKLKGILGNDTSLNKDSIVLKKNNTSIPEKSIAKQDGLVKAKPFFVPAEKPIPKKANDKFITNDFIPAQVVNKANTAIDSNSASLVKSNTEKVSVKLDEKNSNKPVFIPSTKAVDKESEELNRLMNEMKRVAKANLLLKKANNNANSDDPTSQVSKTLTADGKLGQEKPVKTGNNTSTIDSILVSKANANKMGRFRLANVDSLLQASREFPVISHFKIDSIQEGYIYFISNYKSVQQTILPEPGNRFWKWLNILIR